MSHCVEYNMTSNDYYIIQTDFMYNKLGVQLQSVCKSLENCWEWNQSALCLRRNQDGLDMLNIALMLIGSNDVSQ